MPEEKSNDTRTRSWTFIVYPESAPQNWRDILDNQHIEWVESPLHEFDTNPDGDIKKPHWHIVLAFEGKKSFSQIKAITDSLHSPIPQPCHSLRGAIRYMAHLDNPEKYQYSVSEIIGHGGFDVSAALALSSSERYSAIRDMLTFCKDHNICEFQDLLDYAMDSRFDDWFPLLCDNSAYVVGKYIESQRLRTHSK